MRKFNTSQVPFVLVLFLVLSLHLNGLGQFNPIAYWQFEQPNPSADSSGNGNTVLQAVTTGSNDPLVGTYFDTPDAAVCCIPFAPSTLDDNPLIERQLSIEFWYRRDKKEGEGTFIWFQKTYIHFGSSIISFRILLQGGAYYDFDIPLAGIGPLDPTRIYDSRWHHFVLQYDAKIGEHRLWIDGESSQAMVRYYGPTPLIRNGGNLEISSPLGTNQLQGAFDEIAIYDTIIPRELIQLHYHQALDSGLHYTFDAPPANPDDYPLLTNQGEINYLEFGENYPNVTLPPLELLRKYPAPRYMPHHNMPRLVPWLGDPDNRGLLGNAPDPFNTMRYSLEELAREYNYYLYGGLVDKVYEEIRLGLGSNRESTYFLDMLNDPANSGLPRFIYNNWRLMRANRLDPLRPNSTYVLNNSMPNDFYIRDVGGMPIYFTNYGYKFNIAHCRFPYTHPYMDSIAFDGRVYAKMMDTIYTALNPGFRYIDFIGENDETARPLTIFQMTQDSLISLDLAGNNQAGLVYTDFKRYESARTRQTRIRYMDEWKNKIDSVNNLFNKPPVPLAWFDLDGNSFAYDSMRAILPPLNGYQRPTPVFYPQRPDQTLIGNQNLKGFDNLRKAFFTQSKAGDSLFNPAISPGYNDGFDVIEDELMVRPGQFLGMLKAIGFLGADQATLFTYHGSNVFPTQGNWRVWKFVIPAYAQAILSRDSLFWRDGEVLRGDTTGLLTTWYNFDTESNNDLIVARQRYGQDLFYLTGTVQRNSNMVSAGFKEKDVCFEFTDADHNVVFDSLAMQIRLQGSSYVLDMTSGDTLFYQTDAWHEWKDPWHWCRDFEFEAEVFDTVSGTWSRGTERQNPAFPGDFRDFNSWLNLDATTAAAYQFKPRFDSQDTMYCWIRARSQGGAGSLRVEVDGANTQLISGIGTSWGWHSATLPFTGLDTLVHRLEMNGLSGGNVEVDRIGLYRDSGNWPSYSYTAMVGIDTTRTLSQCPFDTIFFSNQSGFGDACVDHQWDFGDGTSAYSAEPFHLYQYPGTYHVTYQASHGCLDSVWTDSFSISIGGPFVDAGPNMVICEGDTVQLNAFANGTFAWSSDSTLNDTSLINPIVWPAQVQWYVITAVDSSACSVSDSVLISVLDLPESGIDTVCGIAGQNIQLSPPGLAAGILWTDSVLNGSSNPDPIVSPLASTLYTFLTWDACNCDSVPGGVFVHINTVDQPVVFSDTTICPGDTITLLSDTGFTAPLWSPIPAITNPYWYNYTVSPANTTLYVLEVEDSLGCSLFDSVLVSLIPPPVLNSTISDTAICYGGSMFIQALDSAGFTWQLNPSAYQVNPSSPPINNYSVWGIAPDRDTTYVLVATDTLTGCSSAASFFVNVDSLPILFSIVPSDTTFCYGENFLAGNAGIADTVIWLSGQPGNQVALAPDTLIAIAFNQTGQMGCFAMDTSYIGIDSLSLTAVLQSGPDTICLGDSIQLQAAGALHFLWSPGQDLSDSTIANPVAAPSQTTTYIVTMTDSLSCFIIDSVQVVVDTAASAPQITVQPSSICLGDTISLSASGAGPFNWFGTNLLGNSSPTVQAVPASTANYVLSISSSFCSANDTVQVFVDPSCCHVPNVDTLIRTGSTSDLIAFFGSNSVSNVEIHIVDTLFVDATFTFNNSILHMDSMAVILIPANRTLRLDSNSQALAACGVMWEGVVADGVKATLNVFSGSTIQDALVAARCINQGRTNMQNSELWNNMVGIRVEGGGLANSTTMWNSEVHSDPATMLPPHTGQQGYMGIYLEDVDGIRIGVNDSSNRNQIHHLSCGIMAVRSNVQLIANDIGFITGQPMPQDYQEGNRKAVFARGFFTPPNAQAITDFNIQIGGAGERGNLVHDCEEGIWVWYNCNANIQQNRLSNVPGLGIYLDGLHDDTVLVDKNILDNVAYGIDVFGSQDAKVNVQRNTIRENQVAIYSVLNTRSEVDIDRNVIRASSSMPGEGIHVSDMNVFGVLTGGYTRLFRNTIRLHGTGIICDAVERLAVEDNTVEVLGPNPATGYGIGINVGGSDSARVFDNLVRWSADLNTLPGTNQEMNGIWMFMSDQALVNCNRTYNWFQHTRIQGPLNRTHLLNNRFFDEWSSSLNLQAIPQRGLYLVNNANVGQQGYAGNPSGNQWIKLEPGNNSTGFWTCNLTDRAMGERTPTLLPATDTFFVKGNAKSNPDNGAVPFCNGAGFPSQLYLQTTPGQFQGTCENFSNTSSGSDLISLQRVAQNSLNSPSNQTDGLFIEEQNFLARMEDNIPLCQSDPFLLNCHQQLSSSNRKTILENEKEQLLDIAPSLQGFNPDNLIEFHHKVVEGLWYHRYLQGMGISSADSSSLDQIARLCPQIGGKAVFQARSLLLETYPGLSFDPQNCQEADLAKRAEELIKPIEAAVFTISPNPGQDLLVLRSNMPGNVKVWSTVGQPISELWLEDRAELQVGSWSRGVYLFRFTSLSGVNTTLKVVLQ